MTMTVTPVVLPDGALDRFREILGPDGVLESATGEFRDPYWHADDHSYEASAVLLPTSTEEVQAVVRLAGELGVPLWTSSQGRNYGYGGPSPRVAGSVLVSLRRMNKVIEINRELAYAVVEPGVRWFDLYEALKEQGAEDLMISIPDLGWGSVIGNSLENGVTYLPYGADFQAPCGMEVVLADGDVLRTGMGAIPDNKSWHLYKRGLGPVLDPLFMQSNLGIVTRMGYWLMRRPEAYAPLFLTVPRDDQLEQVIDICRELRLDGTLRGVPGLYTTLTLAAQMPDILGHFRGGEGPMSEDELQAFADASGVGRWGMRAALWGDRPVVEHQLAKIKAAWVRIEGSKVIESKIFDASDDWDLASFPTFTEHVHAGIPTTSMIETMPPNLGHIGFSPVVPLVGRDVREVVDLMTEITTTEGGVNFAGGVLIINERSCLIVSGLNFDVTDEAQTTRAYATAKSLVREAGARGYGEYRAHVDFMDLATDQYSFNGHAYRRFVEKIKDAVDPHGILSPGRHGVWPARYRGGDR